MPDHALIRQYLNSPLMWLILLDAARDMPDLADTYGLPATEEGQQEWRTSLRGWRHLDG